jgi:hypothetical protein
MHLIVFLHAIWNKMEVTSLRSIPINNIIFQQIEDFFAMKTIIMDNTTCIKMFSTLILRCLQTISTCKTISNILKYI